MKATMFARSVYLSIVLIVTVAVGGCVPLPAKHLGPKASAVKTSKTTKAEVVEEFFDPAVKTTDGRLFLYHYSKEGRFFALFHPEIPALVPFPHIETTGTTQGALLIEFDKNDVVKRRETYKCKPHYKRGDPVCNSQYSLCGVLIEIDDAPLVQRYCDTTAVVYFRNVAQVESLRKPLREAVKRGDSERIEELVAQGADIHGPGEAGRTPLLLVAIKRGHTAVVELLLEKGADVGETTLFMGYTALQLAAKDGNASLVETLLEKGADVNAGRKTPLYFAASDGDVTIAQLLLAAGANVDATHNDTPLSRAVKKGHEEMVKLLIAAGADVNAGPYGKEPLSRAVRKGYEEIAQLLVAKGANVNVIDDKGRALLHLAAAKGRTSLAELLLANGADLNAKDSRGKTPLRLATEWRRKETVELLKRHGAKE